MGKLTSSVWRVWCGRLERAVARYQLVKEERGAVLVLTAFAMVVIFGFAALAIDGGRLYVTRGEIQNSADASALAGGQSLASSQGEANRAAREWADKNGLTGDEVVSVDFNVRCGGGAKDDTITVNVKRNVDFTFARVLGADESDVTACATVQLGSPGEVRGVVPLSVEEDAINYGGTTILKTDSSNKNGANTGPLALGGGGSSTFRDNLNYGYDGEICGSETSGQTCIEDTEPGNMTGPTRDGIEYRLDNTSSQCDSVGEVFKLRSDGKYGFVAGCNPFQGGTGSLRVMLIPVIEELPQDGRKDVEILRFAVFWLEDLPSCSGNNCTISGTFFDVIADIGGTLGERADGIVFARLID